MDVAGWATGVAGWAMDVVLSRHVAASCVSLATDAIRTFVGLDPPHRATPPTARAVPHRTAPRPTPHRAGSHHTAPPPTARAAPHHTAPPPITPRRPPSHRAAPHHTAPLPLAAEAPCICAVRAACAVGVRWVRWVRACGRAGWSAGCRVALAVGAACRAGAALTAA
jgi:hypothetical protein